jgi:hypothetical protein
MKVYHVVRYNLFTKEKTILTTKNTSYEARKYLLENSEGMFSLYIEEEEVPDAPRDFYVECHERMHWRSGS